MNELKKLLQEAEESKKSLEAGLKALFEDTQHAIEAGQIGKAARLFEKTCRYCEDHQMPKAPITPLGYAILLLQECEAASQNKRPNS